jgi:hypothetical protein
MFLANMFKDFEMAFFIHHNQVQKSAGYWHQFMVFVGTILSFIVSKEGKIMDPKKVELLVNIPIPTTPPPIQEIQIFNGMA